MLKFQSESPSKYAIDVSLLAPVYFEVRNLESDSVDINTIGVKINAVDAIIGGLFQVGYSGMIVPNVRGCDVYITHSIAFGVGTTVTIYIVANTSSETYTFTIASQDTVTPVTLANPRGGTYESQQNVTLIVSKPATTHYTIDGSMPTITSPVYAAPITINVGTTLKFFSVDGSNNTEYVHVELYAINIVTPDVTAPVTTASVPSGSYDTLTAVTLSANKLATVYWTLNGANPTTQDNKDTLPLTVQLSAGENILKFFSIDLNGNREQLKTATYFIGPKENNVVPTNVFVSHPYIKNTIDVCWDDMMPMQPDVIGYNVYRSPVDAQYLHNIISHDAITSDYVYSKDDHKFERVNVQLVAATFYRDQTLDRTLLHEDVSDQFRFRTLTDSSTDFSGQIVNEKQWEAIDPDRLFNQSDGIHFTDVYGGGKEAIFQSKFRLKGDFEIESEYNLIGWPVTDNVHSEEVAFIVCIDEFTYIKLSRVRREASDVYIGSLVVNSTETSHQEVVTEQFNGKIKILRFGKNVTILFNDGINWVIINSYLDFSDKDLQVKFYARSSDKTLDAQFSYFHVNSGQSFLPMLQDFKGDYVIQTQHYPIVSSVHDHEYTDLTSDVQVQVDGEDAIIKSVQGSRGLVTLNTEKVYDDVLKRWVEPLVPTSESIVTVTYLFRVKALRFNLNRLPFYKVTAVLSDGSETRLAWCPSVGITASDKLDYTYQEAIRRNSWLLDQAGERVLLFIRKTTGTRCECYLRNMETHRQPKLPCNDCWGTGFIGGYEGPYEIKMAPCVAEQKVLMTERGMRFQRVDETWTTITPVVTQRDFILKRDSQIYAIGPVSVPEVKGTIVQQHFSVEHVDSTDIRYRFIQSLDLYSYSKRVGLRKPFAHYTEDQIIQDGEIKENDRLRTDKGPGYNDPKGRTLSFENTLY